jgi:hypothetical protein
MQYIKKEVEEYKTPQDKILYISFSKAAEREARKRIAYPKIKSKYIARTWSARVRIRC